MNRVIALTTTSPRQTQLVAAQIASVARPGDVIALTGELGAGKTCFVQGAAAALGVTERVTSPSFVLRKDYVGTLPLLHMDIYRLESIQDVWEAGFADALDGTRVTFVEWGDAMAPVLPPDHLEVELLLPALVGEALADAAQAADWEPEPRQIVLRPHGDTWSRRLRQVAAGLATWRVASGDGTEDRERGPGRRHDTPGTDHGEDGR